MSPPPVHPILCPVRSRGVGHVDATSSTWTFLTARVTLARLITLHKHLRRNPDGLAFRKYGVRRYRWRDVTLINSDYVILLNGIGEEVAIIGVTPS